MVGSTRRLGLKRLVKGTSQSTMAKASEEDAMLGSNHFDKYLEFVLEKVPDEKRDWFEYVDSLWFNIFTSGNKDLVLKWCKKRDMFCKKYIFVPIVLWSHWRLVILCHFNDDLTSRNQCILVLDSLQAMEQRIDLEIRDFVMGIMDVKGRNMKMDELKRIPILNPKVPQQTNSLDCGYYTLYYAKEFMHNAPENFCIYDGDYPYFMTKDWFKTEDMHEFKGNLKQLPMTVEHDATMYIESDAVRFLETEQGASVEERKTVQGSLRLSNAVLETDEHDIMAEFHQMQEEHTQAISEKDVMCSGLSALDTAHTIEPVEPVFGSVDDVELWGGDEFLVDINVDGFEQEHVDIENEVDVQVVDTFHEEENIIDDYYEMEEDEGIYVQFLEDGFEDFDESVRCSVQRARKEKSNQFMQYEEGESSKHANRGGVRGFRKSYMLPTNDDLEISQQKEEFLDEERCIDEEIEFYNECCNSENEDMDMSHNFPMHNHESDFLNPQFEVGTIFKTKDDLKAAIVNYGVQIGRPLYFKKNDQVRVRAQCKGNNCSFVIYGHVCSDKCSFQIRTVKLTHECSRSVNHNLATARYLALRYLDDFKCDSNAFKAQVFLDKVHRELNVNISKWIAYRTLKEAKKVIHGR